MNDFDISRDGKQVAFPVTDKSGLSNLWVAPTDHSSSPRHIVSLAIEDDPNFLPDGDLLFRATEGGANFLYQMHADGSDRRKVSAEHIFDFRNASPDGRWAVAHTQATDRTGESPYSVFAFPVQGGSPVRLCTNNCIPMWDAHGEFMYISSHVQADPITYALPIRRDLGLPDLPATIISGTEDLGRLKSAVVIPHIVDEAFSPSLYVYSVESAHRNLYRVLLQ